jgi:hypothetical protein
MCDGLLDTRGMAVWWVFDVYILFCTIVDVVQDVIHAVRWYHGGWKDDVQDKTTKGEELCAEILFQNQIQQMVIEGLKIVEASEDTKQSGEVKLQSWFQKVKRDRVVEVAPTDSMKRLEVPKEHGGLVASQKNYT